ncbi:hypothetical protein [Paramicrobacterium agarici]|uniref:VOC domain-containing protein n=1 Tax=Paramicrobacterium agarici TaxID=630514 RepID=A0A2A9DTK5_9MICO|nr:hypothetical protein [Microbacterium agarici]PFG30117.1 hypothetical protein ATJ78_1038 [Microbacterium agarici]
MTSIQVIQFTQHPRDWHVLAEGLGLSAHGEKNDAWSEFDGDGMLAVHGVDANDSLSGTAEIWMLVDDVAALDALESRMVSESIAVARGEMEGVGATLEIAVDDVAVMHAVVGTARPPHGDVTLLPLIFTANVESASHVLAALGLTLRITSDGGGWAVFDAAGGGSVALHDLGTASTPVTERAGLSFEHRGDLDAIAEHLAASGIESVVVDEAYNRTLRAATPEGPDLWVNGAQSDLYGYIEHS